MLVLTRREDEQIYIGDDIVITVVNISGNRVRIGVTAPSRVPVHRAEVYQTVSHCDKCGCPLTGNRHPLNDRLCRQCGFVE